MKYGESVLLVGGELDDKDDVLYVCVSLVLLLLLPTAPATTATGLCVGAVKYGESVLLVGGEDDKSWMAGMYRLSVTETSTDSDHPGDPDHPSDSAAGDSTVSWVAGQELPVVMSTFGCVTANIRKDLLQQYNSNNHD